jgi:hypothetical protein
VPFRSERQRRYIYAAAARGEHWAEKFIRDSGHTPPKGRKKHKRKKHKRRRDLHSIMEKR